MLATIAAAHMASIAGGYAAELAERRLGAGALNQVTMVAMRLAAAGTVREREHGTRGVAIFTLSVWRFARVLR